MKEQSLREGDTLIYLIIALKLEFTQHSTKYPSGQSLLLDTVPSDQIYGASCPMSSLGNGQCLSCQKTLKPSSDTVQNNLLTQQSLLLILVHQHLGFSLNHDF